MKLCRQCGKSYSARACGPSHAAVYAERKAVAVLTKRLKQRIARVAWRISSDQRRFVIRDINQCIDEWAETERKRGRLTPTEAP